MNQLYAQCGDCCGSGENLAARRGRTRVECAGCDGAGFVPQVIRDPVKRRAARWMTGALAAVWLVLLAVGVLEVWLWV